MPTAQGNVNRQGPNRIMAVFTVDELTVIFSADVSPSLPAFTSKSATLTYNGINDLTSTHGFNGFIGTTTFDLTLDNGTTLKGDLTPPGVNPRISVDGSGVWEQT